MRYSLRTDIPRLTTEPTTTPFAVGSVENIDNIILVLAKGIARLACKYVEGENIARKAQDEYRAVCPIMSLRQRMKQEKYGCRADTQINSEMFVNAVLLEIMEGSGVSRKILKDGHGNLYLSNAVNKLLLWVYKRKRADITRDRKTVFEAMISTVNNLIQLSDVQFSGHLLTKTIPSFIKKLKESSTNCYAENRSGIPSFNLRSGNMVLKYIVTLCDSIISPGHNSINPSVILSKVNSALFDRLHTDYKVKNPKPTDVRDAVLPEEKKEEEEEKPRNKSQQDTRKPLRLPAPGEKNVTIERTGTPSPVPAKLTINDLPTEGINLIDRVMAFLESKRAVFSLDDFNRLRHWAADNVALKVGDKIDSLKKELERLETIYLK